MIKKNSHSVGDERELLGGQPWAGCMRVANSITVLPTEAWRYHLVTPWPPKTLGFLLFSPALVRVSPSTKAFPLA